MAKLAGEETDESWAIRMAMVCAKTATSIGGSLLLFDAATARHLSATANGGPSPWLVFFPEQTPRTKPQGAGFLVDESTGKCTVARLE